MRYLHSGGCGDILYACHLLKFLYDEEQDQDITLYLRPENKYNRGLNIYRNLKELLESQYYISEVLTYPVGGFFTHNGAEIDIDLDHFRLSDKLHSMHLIDCYYDFQFDYYDEWIHVPEYPGDNYDIVSVTSRYRTGYDWHKYISKLENPLFIGTKMEHIEFDYLPYVETVNMYEVATIIKNAASISCNQSGIFALTQSMGLHMNCEIQNSNLLLGGERVLNAEVYHARWI